MNNDDGDFIFMLLMINHQQYINRLLLTCDKQDAEDGVNAIEESVYETGLAMLMLELHDANRPGRGHNFLDVPSKMYSVPPADYTMIDWALDTPTKAMSVIGLTPKEFNYILEFVDDEVVFGRNGGRFRSCKVTLRARLFMLFFFLFHNPTYRVMESIFFVAKSCIQKDIVFLAEVLLDILKHEIGQLWPPRQERDLLRQLLPESLRAFRPFFIVDSTKVTNVDSTDQATRRTHFNTHKRFGSNAIHVVDLLGNLIAVVPFLDGRGNDITQYRQSDMFFQRNGLTWDDDETGIGDHAYCGSSNCRVDSQDLIYPLSLSEIMELPEGLRATAYQYACDVRGVRGVVECDIGGTKRRKLYGDRAKCRMSLKISEHNVALFNELAAYLQGAVMRMRGQIHGSNPAVVCKASKDVNLAKKVINEYTHNLYTVHGHKNRFFGYGLTGLNENVPDVIPLV